MPLTTKEAASLLGINPISVGLAIRQGRLKAIKLGRDWAILRGDLEAYIRLHPQPDKLNRTL
jgi:excisionase family DNA binding protein